MRLDDSPRCPEVRFEEAPRYQTSSVRFHLLEPRFERGRWRGGRFACYGPHVMQQGSPHAPQPPAATFKTLSNARRAPRLTSSFCENAPLIEY
jgi:hypothetical protein